MPCESSTKNEAIKWGDPTYARRPLIARQRAFSGYSAATDHCNREREISDLLQSGCVERGCEVDIVARRFDCSEGRT
jgi:hypothetical protein